MNEAGVDEVRLVSPKVYGHEAWRELMGQARFPTREELDSKFVNRDQKILEPDQLKWSEPEENVVLSEGFDLLYKESILLDNICVRPSSANLYFRGIRSAVVSYAQDSDGNVAMFVMDGSGKLEKVPLEGEQGRQFGENLKFYEEKLDPFGKTEIDEMNRLVKERESFLRKGQVGGIRSRLGLGFSMEEMGKALLDIERKPTATDTTIEERIHRKVEWNKGETERARTFFNQFIGRYTELVKTGGEYRKEDVEGKYDFAKKGREGDREYLWGPLVPSKEKENMRDMLWLAPGGIGGVYGVRTMTEAVGVPISLGRKRGPKDEFLIMYPSFDSKTGLLKKVRPFVFDQDQLNELREVLGVTDLRKDIV